MICPKCGKEVSDVIPVCELCGAALPKKMEDSEEELELEQEQEEAVNESKPLMGFLGALLGAALGCLLIVLLPQIGLTPAFGGIIIAPFIFIGYSILCKGKTKSGLGVCIMFSIFTPYIADRLNWAIWILNNAKVLELEGITLFEAFLGMPIMLDAGKIELLPYYLELFKLYIFAAVGAVAYIAAVARARKKKKMQQMQQQ